MSDVKNKQKRISKKFRREHNSLTPEIRQSYFGKEFLFFWEGSLEDYYRLEEKKADFLTGGIIVMHSPASLRHEELFGDLYVEIYNLLKENQLGKVLGSKFTIVLGDQRFEPDIVFIARDNPGQFSDLEFVGTPDLIIEIISKTTREYDLKTKREVYQKHHVKEICFIDYLNRKTIIDTLAGKKYDQHILEKGEFKSRVLNGFKIGCNW